MITNIHDLVLHTVTRLKEPFKVAATAENYEKGLLEKEARALVEPGLGMQGLDIELISQAYQDIIEYDTDNWVDTVQLNLGSQWADLARIIKESGY